MNNNDLINKLKQKDSNKYNPDINVKYDRLLDTRNQREYKHTTTVWKPIIGSIDKSIIKQDDLRIPTTKPDISAIRSAYEKELTDRNIQQTTIENRLNSNSNSKLEDIKIDENQIKLDNNFDDLKKLANTNIESTNIFDSISKLDELLNSIKNI
jgi:hypothetical protein